jgi:hypothetical protein
MMKRILLIKACFFMVLYTQAQPLKLFQQYQNDTLLANDTRLHENSVKAFTANDVLNKTIVYKNPYPTVVNNSFDGFDAGKVGTIPGKDIYPRLFTAPNEFQGIQSRLTTTNIGKQLLALAKKELDNLHEGKSLLGKAYKVLLVSDTFTITPNFPVNDFANIIAIQGLLAQLNNDKSMQLETGNIAGNFLQAWIHWVDAIPQVQGKEMMVKEQVYSHVAIAKLFDFAASVQTAAQRKAYTNFMVRETTGKYGDGMQLPPHWRRWNHIASALEYPLSALIIENEKGFDKRIYDRGLEVLQDYLTYAFSEEGMSDEGLTYTFGSVTNDLLLMAAAAKRGQPNFWANPHFRKIPDWLIASLSPNPDALWTSHGDTGSASEIPWLMMMILKFYFPNDDKIDYVFANSLPNKLDKLPDVSAFVFAIDSKKTKQEYDGLPPVSLPLTFFSVSRGSFIARNKWQKDAVQFQLDARQDMLFQSHDHADRGNFELASHGRLWVVDGWRSTESKYHSVITINGRGQGYFATPASWINYINNTNATFGVINQKYAYDWMWLKSPVADLMQGKTVAPQWQNGVYADASKRLRQYYPNVVPQRDPLRKVAEYFSGNLTTNPLIWNEDTWPMRLPNYEVAYAFRTAGLVKGKHDYVLIVDDIKKDNQESLYEWLMPMPLDVEVVSIKQLVDVKQESGALNIGFNTLSNQGVQGDYDILLGDKRMKRNMQEVDMNSGETLYAGRFTPKKGDPQLLVRVLNHTPAPRPNLEPNPRLEVIEKLKTEDMHQFYLRTMDLGKRLVIPSRSSEPNFKVLLFPHASGDELPQTVWNNDRTKLIVTFSNQQDEFYFTKGADGKTNVKLIRDGQTIFDLN